MFLVRPVKNKKEWLSQCPFSTISAFFLCHSYLVTNTNRQGLRFVFSAHNDRIKKKKEFEKERKQRKEATRTIQGARCFSAGARDRDGFIPPYQYPVLVTGKEGQLFGLKWVPKKWLMIVTTFRREEESLKTTSMTLWLLSSQTRIANSHTVILCGSRTFPILSASCSSF